MIGLESLSKNWDPGRSARDAAGMSLEDEAAAGRVPLLPSSVFESLGLVLRDAISLAPLAIPLLPSAPLVPRQGLALLKVDLAVATTITALARSWCKRRRGAPYLWLMNTCQIFPSLLLRSEFQIRANGRGGREGPKQSRRETLWKQGTNRR